MPHSHTFEMMGENLPIRALYQAAGAGLISISNIKRYQAEKNEWREQYGSIT